MSTHREGNTLVGAKRFLDLIAAWNKFIKTHRALGEPEDSLAIRQDKHQRQKFINELNEILAENHLLVIHATD